MKRYRAVQHIFLIVALLLLLTGCGALSKQRSTPPLDHSWEGPSGQVGEVRIILEPEFQSVQIDLEELGLLFGDIHLPHGITH